MMNNERTIALIGAGSMAEALIAGMTKAFCHSGPHCRRQPTKTALGSRSWRANTVFARRVARKKPSNKRISSFWR